MRKQIQKSYILLIEGTSSRDNGDLIQGFRKLLQQKLKKVNFKHSLTTLYYEIKYDKPDLEQQR